MSTYRTEFPDFRLGKHIEIPPELVDCSWHNDTMPHWCFGPLNLWIDYEEPEKREAQHCTRFAISAEDADGNGLDILRTDCWSEVLCVLGKSDMAARYGQAMEADRKALDKPAQAEKRSEWYRRWDEFVGSRKWAAQNRLFGPDQQPPPAKREGFFSHPWAHHRDYNRRYSPDDHTDDE